MTGPPNHHEPQGTFWLVEGELEFGRVGAAGPEWLPIRGGNTITVPSWAFYGCRNHGQRNARVLLLCAAGLGPFLREIGRPVALGAPISAEPPLQAELERVFRAAQKIPCYAYSA